MVAAVRKNAIVSAAGHGRHKPNIVSIQQPGIAPLPFDKLVERAPLLVWRVRGGQRVRGGHPLKGPVKKKHHSMAKTSSFFCRAHSLLQASLCFTFFRIGTGDVH